MFSTAQNVHVNNWLNEWRRYMESKSDETSDNLKMRLLEPIRLGDPVFCTALGNELSQPDVLSLVITVLCSLEPSRKRILQCEILFYLCKCSSAENRILSASVIPFLIWIEWLLSGSFGAEKDEKFEEDVAAIEIALLAMYQQDFNINPLPIITQIIPLGKPSIYHQGIDIAKEERNATCCRVNQRLYPSFPLDKFEEPNRNIITYRLCRIVCDHLPDLDDRVLATFGLLIARLAIWNTKLDDKQIHHQLQSGSLLSNIAVRNRSAPERRSDLNLQAKFADIRGDDQSYCSDPHLSSLLPLVIKIFFTLSKDFQYQKRRFPMSEDLALLWADGLAVIKCHFPVLEEYSRSYLLARVRTCAYPLAILALSE